MKYEHKLTVKHKSTKIFRLLNKNSIFYFIHLFFPLLQDDNGSISLYYLLWHLIQLWVSRMFLGHDSWNWRRNERKFFFLIFSRKNRITIHYPSELTTELIKSANLYILCVEMNMLSEQKYAEENEVEKNQRFALHNFDVVIFISGICTLIA